jgi:hypothetical protein
MTTEKQAEGKAASRLKALRHGLRARTVVQEACDPQNSPEELLVEKMVIAEWQLARLQRAESILLLEQHGTIDAAHMPLFDRLSQFQARLERTSIRVYKELLQLAKTP